MNTLKALLKRQKSLIIIFLLTIVLPSLALSISGIFAIRNEKYRVEKNILDKQQGAIKLLQNQLSVQFEGVKSYLERTAALSSLRDHKYSEIKSDLMLYINENETVDQIFILFKNGDVFFPIIQNQPKILQNHPANLKQNEQKLLREASKQEYIVRDYYKAISIFQGLYDQASEYQTKAQILNDLARVQKKSGDILLATETFIRIIENYPLGRTTTGLPLVISSEIQVAECDRIRGNKKQALNRLIGLFERLLNGEWTLSQNQFLSYSEIASEKIQELLNDNMIIKDNLTEQDKYSILMKKYLIRVGQWKDKNLIELEVIPELKEKINKSQSEVVNLFRTIQGIDFLISAINGPELLAIKWDRDQIVKKWLQPLVNNLLLNEKLNVTISDLDGKILLGNEIEGKDQVSVYGEFENFFPPWKIKISEASNFSKVGINLFSSYYFWSILTAFIIIIFGTLLIFRIISREREIISIKSDFIASVSHELKTPLTSIKALIERLLSGKIKEQEKMQEYFSVIDQDANKLTRLVKNILDFSKIEEGKKEYNLVSTEIVPWLDKTIDEFIDDHIHEKIKIKKNFDLNISSIKIDRDALSLCLNNLLDNAIKFSEYKKEIEFNLRQNTDYLIIEVKDYGIGMKREDIGHIFDKFYQGQSSSGHSVKGVGLGLAIVKHAIQAHRGKIVVTSTPGQGSTFTIFLPKDNSESR